MEMMKVLPEDVTPIDKLEDIAECRSFLKRIEEAEKNGFNPYFVPHEKPLRDVSIMNGKEVINFGSYNYLGMSGRTEIAAASKKAIDDYGTSASGSRILAGEKNLFIELEKEIADWKHTEAAMVLAAGNLTNTTFVGNFCGKNDAIFFDVLSHSSIEQGCKLSTAYAKRFSHNNYQSLERMLVRLRSKFQKVLIVIDGVYSMDGDIAPVPEFVRLKKKYGCFLMVDEAHSTGVIGPTGAGVDEYFCLMPDDIDIKMGTLSKALGSIGGYIASKNVLINYLKYNLPGFVFAAGITPASAAGALASIRLIRSDASMIKRLQDNIHFFLDAAHRKGFHTCLARESAIVPVMIGKDENAFVVSKMMGARGIFVPPASYPAVSKGQARLRFSIISEHKREQIIQALDTLDAIIREHDIEIPRRYPETVL